MADLAKGYVHAQRMVGADKVAIPGKDATDEQWAEVYAKLGRPGKPEDYDLSQSQLPEGVQLDEGLQKEFLDQAHTNGLNKRQAARLYDWFLQRSGQAVQAQQQAREQALAQAQQQLKQTYGQAYEAKLELAREAVATLGGEDLASYLEESGLGNDPRLIQAMVKAGEALAEDDLLGKGGAAGGLTPAEARSQIQAKQADPEFFKAYTDRTHPGHQEALAQMQRLYAAATAAG